MRQMKRVDSRSSRSSISSQNEFENLQLVEQRDSFWRRRGGQEDSRREKVEELGAALDSKHN